jgi:restriction system protein
MLQDWSSAEFLSKAWSESSAVLGREPSLPTNRTLDRLLREHLALDIGDTYGTNLFPFIKPGGIAGGIRMSELRRAAREFGWPQIEVVAPRLVIALGLDVYRALAQESGYPRARSLPEAIGAPLDVNGVRLWCQAHTGSRGQNNRRQAAGPDAVRRDWAGMGDWLRSAGPS